MRTFLAFLTVAALSPVAFADELTLRNGSTFTGSVREEGDRVTIETEFGFMTFKKIDVRSVVRGRDVVREFSERAQTAGSVKELLELAGWAREKGMTTRAEEVYRRIIARDPDQPDARRALGYERVDGQWLQGDDLLIARGFLKIDGRWLPKDVAVRVLEQQALARIETERLETEARIAAQRREVETARLALDRERLEMERKAQEFYQQVLLEERRRMEEELRRYPRTPSPYYFAPEECREPVAVATPPQSQPQRPAARVPAPPPQRRDFSPVPLTPPTVLPLTPPTPVPNPRPSQPPEKEDEDKKR